MMIVRWRYLPLSILFFFFSLDDSIALKRDWMRRNLSEWSNWEWYCWIMLTVFALGHWVLKWTIESQMIAWPRFQLTAATCACSMYTQKIPLRSQRMNDSRKPASNSNKLSDDRLEFSPKISPLDNRNAHYFSIVSYYLPILFFLLLTLNCRNISQLGYVS